MFVLHYIMPYHQGQPYNFDLFCPWNDCVIYADHLFNRNTDIINIITYWSYMLLSEWRGQSGEVRVVRSEWAGQSSEVGVGRSEWRDQSGKVEVGRSEWWGQSGRVGVERSEWADNAEIPQCRTSCVSFKHVALASLQVKLWQFESGVPV